MAQILLIESDKILAANIAKFLKKRGHDVDWQVNPQVALDSADTRLPDIIILDLVLAGRGGVEFLYEFRSYPDWQNVPIILFSSLSPEELKGTLDGFEHLNITDYHYKSNTPLSKLTQTVDRVLQPAKA
ncbi:MAG TPA: response regulator [Candidatus Saccharimonadales bacterium]|nr:response regulator [Candidatus Saccharimonadales bacterium]